MTPHELSVVRQRLETFAADVFAPLARSDQRAKGQLYMRGLLLDGRRKSMQPMAARLGVDHQGLQQFVTTSTWDPTAVRRRLAEPRFRAADWFTPPALNLVDLVDWIATCESQPYLTASSSTRTLRTRFRWDGFAIGGG